MSDSFNGIVSTLEVKMGESYVTRIERELSDAKNALAESARKLEEAERAIQEMKKIAIAREPFIAQLQQQLAEALTFKPTHKHADGGLYQLIGPGLMKGYDSDWSTMVLYKAADGKMYGTTQERWEDRFAALEASRAAE